MRSTRTQAVAGSTGINNAIRGLAAIVKRAIGSQGSAIASAATTAIGAAGTALYTTITGTTPITSFGSVGAGTYRIVEFTGALTLTHNATSLKLPGSANITTAAGDVGYFVSLGSGNWKCLHYSKADGSAVASFSGTLTSTDAGSAEGPAFVAFRDSASPAANDMMGALRFNGRDSGGALETYAALFSEIVDPTAGSEDGRMRMRTRRAGADADWLMESGAIRYSTLNQPANAGGLAALAFFLNNDRLIGTIARYYVEYSTNADLSTTIPLDDTVPTSTEGTQILSQAVTTTSNTQRVRIRVNGVGEQASTGAAMIMALFRGTTCVQVSDFNVGGGLYVEERQLSLEYEEQPGAAGSYTYSVRVGASSGAMRMNGTNAGRLFGGAAKTTMVIEVFEP
jgi:hypothetical protein